MMMNHSSLSSRSHGMPTPLGPALGRLAGPLGETVVSALASRIMAARIREGELDFLRGCVVAIKITDADITWHFTLTDTRARIESATGSPGTTIRGDSGAFLLMASRRVDPDTLFFNRRLFLEGDTELGLQLKNVLDTLESDELPRPLARLLDHAGRVAERWS